MNLKPPSDYPALRAWSDAQLASEIDRLMRLWDTNERSAMELHALDNRLHTLELERERRDDPEGEP